MYNNAEGVEEDSGKKLYHLELAAIGGHLTARYYLGYDEEESGNRRDQSGFVSREDLAALRAHQAAVDATKSHQRKVAEIATYEMSQQKFL
eukprot:scaffold37538_cov250-Skeletonema_dohrnii-CCMP3373.AAC.2